jgi:type I restriction enzyme S subunit
MEWKKLKDVFQKPINGAWGKAPKDEDKGLVKVLRTTNFTNNGKLDLESEVVLRKIKESKVEKKKLEYGDIIIEKSGGSPTQPVGRVVFFDQTDDTYLCNNFTAVLRTKEGYYSKYIIYMMLYLYKTRVVLKFQNKTTGIGNLKLKSYLSRTKIPVLPIEIQQKIAAALDKAQELIDKRREQLEKLDEFVESVFLDMFGDPATNPNEWQVEKMNYFINDIRAGWSIGGESRQKKENEIGVLKISSVTTGKFLKDEYKVVDKEKIKKDLVHPLKGDVLFSRANTRELVAATCIVDDDYTDLFLPDKLWKIILDREIVNSYYFVYLLRNERYRHRLTRKATGSSGSMLNISQKKLLNTKFPIAPLELQNKFAQIVEATEEKRKILEESLAEMKNNFNSIMQKAFKGELF